MVTVRSQSYRDLWNSKCAPYFQNIDGSKNWTIISCRHSTHQTFETEIFFEGKEQKQWRFLLKKIQFIVSRLPALLERYFLVVQLVQYSIVCKKALRTHNQGKMRSCEHPYPCTQYAFKSYYPMKREESWTVERKRKLPKNGNDTFPSYRLSWITSGAIQCGVPINCT